MNFGVIDWVFSGIIILFAIGGVIKGFIDNVFGKIAFVAGILLAYLFYKDIAVRLLKDIKVEFAAKIISFLGIPFAISSSRIYSYTEKFPLSELTAISEKMICTPFCSAVSL